MRANLIAGALSICVGAVLGCTQGRFNCVDDAGCSNGGQQGVCQSNGRCSFPDETCPSGQRYGEHAGHLSGVCVEPEDDASTGGGTSGSSSDGPSSPSGSSPSTTLDDDTATAPGCGDEVVDADEECDGRDLGGADCASVGFFDGELACSNQCTFDTSGCHQCGDGRIQPGEECDPAAPVDGTCQDLGWFAGTIVCDHDCHLDQSGCTNCGNGIVDPGEQCDGESQALPSCTDAGYMGDASLGCTETCTLSTEDCGVLACGVDLEQPLTPCPTVCDSCDDGECVIACHGTSACNNDMIDCPPGWPCRISCQGTSSCAGTTLSCPPFHACQVSCDGTSACSGASMICSVNGGCSLRCGNATSSCGNADIDCGADTCSATCDGASQPNLACGPSCDCNPC
jgi:hypothetical protein